MIKSLSMIVPGAAREDANALLAALGRGENTFAVDLSATAEPPATHWGAHTFDDELLTILESGALPPGIDWPAHGLSEGSAQAALAAISFRGVADHNSVANFEAHSAANGVGRIAEETT